MLDLKNMNSIDPKALFADKVFTFVCWTIGIFTLCLPLSILLYLLINSIEVLSWEFVFQKPKGFPLGIGGGIFPAIKGSFQLIGIGLCVALPLAISGAVYLSEFCRNQYIVKTIRFMFDSLAGIPSIVYGLFGYAFFVVFLNFRISLLSGGITLGLIMFPKIFIGAYEAFNAIDNESREAVLSLGVTRLYLVRRVVLKKGFSRIIEITVLAASHAFGTAAPVLITASVIQSYGKTDLFSPVMTLPTHLYYLVGEAISFDHAYGTASVMIILLLGVNFLMMFLKRYHGTRG